MKINIVITNPTDGSSIREEKSFLLKKKFIMFDGYVT